MTALEKTNTSNALAKRIMTALFAAILCVIGPLAIPVGPVPITLATLILYLSIYVLGTGYASLACVLYLVMGLVGLPVFTNYSGGIGKLAGPTGGYLIGYVPMVLVGGLFITMFNAIIKTNDRSKGVTRIMTCVLNAVALIIATAVLYFLGTAWFMISTGTPLGASLALCVLPFIIGDLAKIAVAVILGPSLRSLIDRIR